MTTIVSIAGFGVMTTLIAFLPGYARVGTWAMVMLLAIRFIGGIFMGGEYTSNNTLALEMVPKERRGFVGGLIQGAYPVGFALTTVLATIMLSLTAKEQYLAWGWRIPFLVGGAIAFGFLLYYRLVPESPLWEASEKSTAPLREVTSGWHLRTLGQIFLMMSGFWLIAQPSNVLPRIMIQHLDVSSRMTSNTFLVSSIVLFFIYIGYGVLSQMIGRRRAIVLGGALSLVGGAALYRATVAHGLSGGAPLATAVLVGAFNAFALAPLGIATVYICERFPTMSAPAAMASAIASR